MPTPQNETQTTELLKSALAMLALEREQCAALLEREAEKLCEIYYKDPAKLIAECAKLIRARGKNE